MAAKLTLSVDPEVVVAAKAYAAARQRSLSELVEATLAALTLAAVEAPPPPQLARWRGALADVDVEDARVRWVEKYGV